MVGINLFALPWLAIFPAALAAWRGSFRWLVIALLIAGYGAALASGQLDYTALLSIALLLAAAWAVGENRTPYCRYTGHAVFILVAVALSFHILPGFHNPRVIGPLRYSADAVPFTMYLNFDKPLAGFWLMLVLPWIRPVRGARAAAFAGLGALLASTAVCLALALAFGLVAWAPKMPADASLWLLNNLLLVTFTEEALFRGYVQGGLARLLKHRPYGEAVALCAGAVLFGLAHLAGGWQWAVVAGFAGIGYGLAYRHGGLQAAVLAHFGLNTAQFFLFTYPMLQRAAG
jgi:membrane protease YdiL (CAAX protease family)